MLPRLVAVTLSGLIVFLLTASVCTADEKKTAPRKPNIVLILVDDLGWTDLSCQGSTFYKTPHIDRLAQEGMRFTNAYSACTVCSPTRAALLTGQYPARLHITDWIEGHKRPQAKLRVPDWTMHLPHETTTIAEELKSHGYATALMGKWHLGDEEYGPTKHGFDLNLGGNDRGQPPSYFFPYERQNIKLPGLEQGKDGEYLTDRLTDEAVAWIEQQQDRPFFLYLPHYTVHTPIQAKKDLAEKYQAAVDPSSPHQNAAYAAMIDSLDQSVGRIMDKLRELKLDQDTIFVFTSDNGGLINITSQPPLRAGKGSAYEGGVRVPLIVRFPPQVKPGVTSEEPVITMDLVPTLLDLAGLNKVRQPDDRGGVDGVSLTPLLAGKSSTLDRDAIYWHYPHYHPGGATPYSALRSGDYRLVEFFEDGRTELYNVRKDVGEQNDLARQEPEKREELHRKLIAWRQKVGAQMPTPNPDYDPNAQPAKKAKAKRNQAPAKGRQ